MITTIPPLPTDSLYKFLFVFGIILFISSCYFSIDLYKQIDRTRASIDSSANVLNKRILGLEMVKDSLDGKLTAIFDYNKRAYAKLDTLEKKILRQAVDTGVVNRILRRHNIKVDSVSDQLRKINKRDSTVRIADQEINERGASLFNINSQEYFLERIYLWGLLLSGIAGVVSTIYGYKNWQSKVQIHQDRILELQRMQLEKELAKKGIVGRKHRDPLTHKHIKQ